MSALPVQNAPPAAAGATPGQWRPTDPSRPRTPKQRKRELRKDRHRRRRIMERAQCDPTLTHTAVRVLDVLMKHSDDTAARVWPKMITLAIPVGIALRSARRCVAELEAAGYVLRYMRPIAGSMNLSNMYYFREPAGPIAHHRANQRRRPRMRTSHRGTLETAGTPEGVKEPSTAGAAKPSPPPRKPAWRRDLPPSTTTPAQPPPFQAQPPQPPLNDTERQAAVAALRQARALLHALRAQQQRP